MIPFYGVHTPCTLMPEKAGQTHHDETLHALHPKIGNSSTPPFELRRGTHPCPLPGGEYKKSPLGRGFRGG